MNVDCQDIHMGKFHYIHFSMRQNKTLFTYYFPFVEQLLIAKEGIMAAMAVVVVDTVVIANTGDMVVTGTSTLIIVSMGTLIIVSTSIENIVTTGIAAMTIGGEWASSIISVNFYLQLLLIRSKVNVLCI